MRTVEHVCENNKQWAEQIKAEALCEVNVTEQVSNICHTAIVQNAWDAGNTLSAHGWIYSIKNGILKDLGVCITGSEEVSTNLQNILCTPGAR